MKLRMDGEAGAPRIRVFMVLVGLFHMLVGWYTLNYAPGFIAFPVLLALVFMTGGAAAILRAFTPHSVKIAVIAGAGMVGGSILRAIAIMSTLEPVDPVVAFVFDPSISNQEVSRIIAVGQWLLLAAWVWISWAPMCSRADGDPEWWRKT